MELNFSLTNKGMHVEHKGKKFSLIYPNNFLKDYPEEVKRAWSDNTAHLMTINTPLVAKKKNAVYNISPPLFKKYFKKVVIGTIPGATDDYKQISTKKVIERFENIEYDFKDGKEIVPEYNSELKEKAIVPLSCGKDSLTTLAVCDELGLKPMPVYINDTVSPSENSLKLEHSKKLCKEKGFTMNIVINEIEKLNDFDHWNAEESCIGYSHMLTGFCFISLPIMHSSKSRYVIVGNQQDMNFSFKNKEGYKAYPSYDQTEEWMIKQNEMISKMTGKQGKVISVIEPLTNIAITKILHSRYPEYWKYQVCCDCLDASHEKRWCHECNKCARLSLFMKSFGIDPKKLGLRDLLDKKHKELYCLFGGKEADAYEKSKEARDQQLLAFYMASKEGQKGYLIDKFKEKFIDEAREREKELRKRFFKIYKSKIIPSNIQKELNSIYKEELKDHQ